MIIPRYSVRWLLALMASCAVVAYIISLAVAGRTWAVCVSLSIASIALTFVLYAAAFVSASCISVFWRYSSGGRSAASPFATHTAPPQLLRPEEPD